MANSNLSALVGKAITVPSTATELTAILSNLGAAGGTGTVPKGMSIKNPSGSGQTIWIGDSSVTTSDGFPIYPGETQSVDLINETVWLITASPFTAYVLYSKKG